MIKKTSNKYLHFIITVLVATSVIIALTIFYIINITFVEEVQSNYSKAFHWQAKHKGVVGITVNISNKYKQRMLQWRLAKEDVDTIILGSSTVMGIKEDMFVNHTVFNGAQNSNILYYMISAAKYHSKYTKSVKTIIIGFDWALGLPYWNYTDITYKPKENKQKSISYVQKIKDAISYQRVKIVFNNIINHIFEDPIVSYKCPHEDTVGTDQFFNTDKPKSCHGFRYDGSAVFPGVGISEKKWIYYLAHGLKKYQTNFDKYLGTIDARYLKDFKEINSNLKAKGGKLIIIIPPLIPHAVATMEKLSKKSYIDKLDKLLTYTDQNNIDIINASKSEEFGCIYSDFLDAHHAFPSCYKRIFDKMSL